MPVQNGIDLQTRERVYTNDFAQQREFALAVFGTSIGKRFKKEFENTDENIQAVLDAVEKLFPGEPITESRFLKALELSMVAGDLVRKPAAPVVEQTPEPEVPRDKRGRPLTAAQIKWGEYQKFLSESSSAQVTERRRTDVGFREFCQHNLREQMAQEIDGAVVAQDDIRPKAPRVDDKELTRLQKFAEDFNALPAAAARKKMLAGFNPAWASFTADFEKCRALRLL
jgi:hypothetical protein